MSTVRVTFARVIHSEWTKIWSLRSTWLVLGVTALLTVGFAGAIGWATRNEPAPTTGEALARAYLSIDLFSLVIGVFGVLLMTGEYGSGLIRATLAAVPRRLPVLAAKALVLAAATLPLLVAVCFAAFVASQAFLDAGDRVSLGEADVLRAVFGAAAAPVGFGLLGLGIGALLRHTALAITTYVVAMLVLPALLPAALPESIQDEVVSYAPVTASQAMYAVGDANPFQMLSPGAGALVTLGWLGLILAGGAALLLRRDA
jgi:hypothetical protein